MPLVIAYFATAIVFFALDYVWLSRVAFKFYLFYIAGIVYFAVNPALAGGSWTQAMVAGAILGLIAYGTYDMTNLATIKNWSISVTVIDIVWGATLTAGSATAGYFAVRALTQ